MVLNASGTLSIDRDSVAVRESIRKQSALPQGASTVACLLSGVPKFHETLGNDDGYLAQGGSTSP
jgi:hypothetical protein